VPELLLDEVDRFARSQPQRRGGMTKVMEAYTGPGCPPERWHVPALAHVAHAKRGADSRREHEDAAAPRYDESVPMLAENRDHRGVDCYGPGAVALRGARFEVAPEIDKLARHDPKPIAELRDCQQILDRIRMEELVAREPAHAPPGRRRSLAAVPTPGCQRAAERSLFLLVTGIPSRALPPQLGYGSGVTCWRRLEGWMQAEVWEQLHAVLLAKLRSVDRIDWSLACVDGSHVQAK
jgi:transposase